MSDVKGRVGYWLGKHRSEETKEKLRLWRTGKKLSTETKDKISKYQKGKPKSLKTRALMSKNHTRYWKGKTPPHMVGESNPNWGGGTTSVNRQIRHCFQYKLWRAFIFERDKFTCVVCNKKGDRLEADHYPKAFIRVVRENNIHSLGEALECVELWNTDNGRTLCITCHNKTKWGRKTT